MSTFVDKLRRFTLSVDYVTRDNYDNVMQTIHNYTKTTIGVKSISVLIATNDLEGKELSLNRENDDNYKFSLPLNLLPEELDARALSFKTKSPMWVINKGGANLVSNENLEDQWSGNEPLNYSDSPEEGMSKLSINVPLKGAKERIFGVVSFDSESYFAITEEAKKEFETISDLISILYRKLSFYSEQRIHTNNVVRQLEGAIERTKIRKGIYNKKLSIFLASPGDKNGDEVVGKIKEVASESEFCDKFDLVFWEDINKSGDINIQIIRAISECQYGICYFSERDEEGKIRDNFNVTFEAGMLHVLVNNQIDAPPEAWIPIREKEPPKLPFDFSTQRILIVPRDKNNLLIVETFKNDLRKRLRVLFENNE